MNNDEKLRQIRKQGVENSNRLPKIEYPLPHIDEI